MNNKELQKMLSEYPDDIDVRYIMPTMSGTMRVMSVTADNVIETSETARVNSDAPEDEWDTEDGKIELGNGKRYLLINALVC